MALGFTGAVRLGHEEADNYELFVGILGCNVAWAIVDGVMYVLTELFERGRKARLARDVRNASTEEAALRQIGSELEGPLMDLTSPEERLQLYRWVLAIVRREELEAPRVHREDLLGGVAVALAIVLATFPIVVPYLVVSDPEVAVRMSNVIALTLLFLLGARWGQIVGGNRLRVASGLTLVGLVLVLVTILLGG
jgi:VIT1/CCC1 family predicted Fe2+/Mn2+ transporter